MIAVKTHSGRLYEFDFDTKTYTRSGDAPDYDFTAAGDRTAPRKDTKFVSVQVDDLGRMVILEPEGRWIHTTRVAEGLDDLLAVIDQ